jgi:hypothetical protein
VTGDILQQLEHSRHLPLCEQVDLQVEVAAFVGLPRQAVLARQHEERQQDGALPPLDRLNILLDR